MRDRWVGGVWPHTGAWPGSARRSWGRTVGGLCARRPGHGIHFEDHIFAPGVADFARYACDFGGHRRRARELLECQLSILAMLPMKSVERFCKLSCCNALLSSTARTSAAATSNVCKQCEESHRQRKHNDNIAVRVSKTTVSNQASKAQERDFMQTYSKTGPQCCGNRTSKHLLYMSMQLLSAPIPLDFVSFLARIWSIASHASAGYLSLTRHFIKRPMA